MTTHPTLIFDGNCGFCTRCVVLAHRVLPGEVRYFPWQEADLAALGVSEQDCREAVQWVPVTGAPAGGHRAVAAALRSARWPWTWAGLVLTWPVVSLLAARVYHWVADHRSHLPGVAPACGWSDQDRAALTGSTGSPERHRSGS